MNIEQDRLGNDGGGFLCTGMLLSGLSLRFVGCMMTVNWAVSLQHLFEGNSRS